MTEYEPGVYSHEYEMNKHISVARLVAVLDANGNLMSSVILDGSNDEGLFYTLQSTHDEETGQWGEPVTLVLRGRSVDHADALPMMLRIGEAIMEKTRSLMELQAARRNHDF